MSQTTASLHLADLEALTRYRHLLRTADPDQLEWAHEEAFDAMTATARRTIRERLADELAPPELSASDLLGEEPRDLARVAVRWELKRPGTLERALGVHVDRVAAVVVGAVAIDVYVDIWMRD